MGKYHFIAIGGIGMSGLAKYLLQDGHKVSGSDIQDSKYISALRDMGAEIFIGHNAVNVPENATVIVSTAIRENNPELCRARELGLKIYHRSDLLKEMSEKAKAEKKCFIGFSGTHGKTTTSGLSAYVLEHAGLKPSFVVGGIIPELHTNAGHNSGKYFTAELDESDGTIVKYHPDILVINNLEADHQDFYKNGLSDLIKTFDVAVKNSSKVIVNADNEGVKLLDGDFVTFGLTEKSDYYAKNIIYDKEGTKFDLYIKGEFKTNIKTILSGEHNVYNFLAVFAALNEAGVDISDENIYNAAAAFSGMGRRFQKVCEFDGVKVYDDYAHHPTEIRATLNAAAAKFGKENIVAVFQPHRYTRLSALWNEFKYAFNNADRVFVTDVYAASEDPIDGINSENFAKELKNSEYIPGSIEEAAKKLKPALKSGDVVVGLGAGTITKLGQYLRQ